MTCIPINQKFNRRAIAINWVYFPDALCQNKKGSLNLTLRTPLVEVVYFFRNLQNRCGHI